MRSNLDDQQRNTLTKKFWSYVKSTTKSSGIPETVYQDSKSSCNPERKANINTFPGNFPARRNTIDIDFSNDEIYDIDFSQNVVK